MEINDDYKYSIIENENNNLDETKYSIYGTICDIIVGSIVGLSFGIIIESFIILINKIQK